LCFKVEVKKFVHKVVCQNICYFDSQIEFTLIIDRSGLSLEIGQFEGIKIKSYTMTLIVEDFHDREDTTAIGRSS
jgi:hypothetical protein